MLLLAMGLALFTLALNITVIVLQRKMIAELETQLAETFALVDNTLKVLETCRDSEDADLAQWAENTGRERK